MEEISKTCLNTARVCRFCLSQNGVMSPIFDEKYNTTYPTLSSKIMSFARIQLLVNDGLPSVLCHRCLYLAENAYDFKTQCEASDSMLRDYLSMMQASLSQNTFKRDDHNQSGTSQVDFENMPASIKNCQSQSEPSLKRKRGRPRKEENLIFYSSPEHPVEPPEEVEKEKEVAEANESVVTIVEQKSETLSNSDEENKQRDLESSSGPERRDVDTARSLAIARAKAKKYMGVIFTSDDNGVKTRRHLCKGCGKTFGHCSDLRKHVLVHTGERPFHCQLCTKTFSRSTNLNKHLKVHSGQKPFACSKCPKSFTSKGDLQRHLIIHSGVKPFCCSQCQQSFSRKDKLTRHVRLHDHSLPSHGYAPCTGYGYAHCDNSCEQDTDVNMAHLLDEEGEEFTPKKDDKVESGAIEDDSAEHVDFDDHGVESMVINIDPFPMQNEGQENGGSEESPGDSTDDHWTVGDSGLRCVFCQRVCADEAKMRIHLSNHMLGRPHKCQLCDKAFTRRRELLRHESVHTGLKPHKCHVCSRAFARKDKLARHVKIHADEKNAKQFYCELCSLSFCKQELFDVHMVMHSQPNGEGEGYEEPSIHGSGVDSDEANSDDEFGSAVSLNESFSSKDAISTAALVP